MRTFYIFKIRKEFVSLYKNKQNSLYNIFKHMYFMKNIEFDYGCNLFIQVTEKINKNELDKLIYNKYCKELVYTRDNNNHIINNLYSDEISILTIRSAYILLTINKNNSTFFNTISTIGSNYFACDFNTNDYFWVKDIKTLV